jgi:outer membrane protein assembly factor BamD
MGDRFDDKKAAALARIVKDFPLSGHVDEAKEELTAMKRPVPDADPVAYARMKYELENRQKAGVMSHFWGAFKKNPDTRLAAKSGSPQMETMHPTVPASVPVAVPAGGVSGDVGISTVGGPNDSLDKLPDARATPPTPQPQGAAAPAAPGAPAGQVTATTPGTAAQTPAGGATTATDSTTNPSAPAASATQPLPTNHPMPQGKQKKPKKDKKKKTPEVKTPEVKTDAKQETK